MIANKNIIHTRVSGPRGSHPLTLFESVLTSSQHLCVLAWLSALARALTERVQGTSAFLFAWADVPLQRGLAQRRKEMGWFQKSPDLQTIRPDVGPQPQRRFGLTGASEW